MRDVIVVGAGPSGSFAAMKCAESGLDVLLLESQRFPRDKPCGGVVAEITVKSLGGDILSVLEREASRNDFFYDWKYIGHIDTHEYFFKRVKLDHYLVKKAVASGAELMEDVRATGLDIHADAATVHTPEGDLRAQVVIGADGVNSVIGCALGLSHYACDCRFVSLKAEIDVTPQKAREIGVEDPPRQQTHFFSDLVGFAWMVPNDGSVNAGYGSTVSKSKDLKNRFHKFLGGFGLKTEREGGSQIPFLTLRRIYSERVLLTGDAGGFVNPWTGAGIDEGIIASANAAAVCKEAVDSQDFSAELMSKFQRLCSEQIRRINWRGRWIKVLDRIMPMDAEFPFWVRFLVRRLSTVA